MKRREFIALVGGTMVACPLASIAQSREKVHRIGVLETIAADLNRQNLNAFRFGMSERGYAETRNYIISYRSADGYTERFQMLADELVREDVDLIVTRGTPAALAAKAATLKIPIVMSPIGDPMLVVASLAHPGGNITGLTSLTQELAAKRASILKEWVPEARRLAVLLNMANPTLLSDWTSIERAGDVQGFKAVLLDVRRREDFARALETARTEHVDAMIVSTDTVTQANRDLVAELAAKYRIPTIYPSREFIDAGGLIMYGVDYPDLYRRAAIFVDKILRGANPADLPVERPTKFEMLINLKAAKALGLTVPSGLLAQADEVIE